jgi:hypothetical protein
MGNLHLNTDCVVVFDDRTLAHLQAVIGGKLRRAESFFFSYSDEGRPVAHWINPILPLRFTYDELPPKLNRAWVELLTDHANSVKGLEVVPEPREK